MEVIRFNEYVKKDVKVALSVAIGEFDGLHLGHMRLINKAIEEAALHKMKSAVITFEPHPQAFIKKVDDYAYITPLCDKIQILRAFKLDYLIIIDFNDEVMMASPQAFVQDFLVQIQAKCVVVGNDFTFGFKKEGKASDLEKLSHGNLQVHIMDDVKYESWKISSSLIREKIENGAFVDVQKMLGRFYQLKGTVTRGRGVGHTIDLPTINLDFSSNYVMPKPGVYGTIVEVDGKKYIGLANYGHNPSFNYKKCLTLEINLLDIDIDLYDKEVSASFVCFIRDEIKFASTKDFLKQIAIDKAKIRKIVSIYL